MMRHSSRRPDGLLEAIRGHYHALDQSARHEGRHVLVVEEVVEQRLRLVPEEGGNQESSEAIRGNERSSAPPSCTLRLGSMGVISGN